MIFIAVRFKVQPEHADEWTSLVDEFTRSTRAEPGNLWFDWSRSVDDPAEFVLLEAFRDGEAGASHVKSPHFRAAVASIPRFLAETPRIINVEVPGEDWSEMAEMQVHSFR